MELRNKKTTLTDDAALYHHREDISEKEKWANMSGKERWEYFKSYYLLKILGILVAVAVVCSILYTMLAPKPEVMLSVAIADRAMTQDQYLKVQEEFDKIILTDPEKQETIFDGGYDFEYDLYQSMQKFAIYNAAGELDVTIMPLSVFEVYGPKGHFSKVSSKLSTELYLELQEYFAFCSLLDEDGKEIENSQAVYGIRLDQCPVFREFGTEEEVILAINMGTSKDAAIEKFLRYLFSLE